MRLFLACLLSCVFSAALAQDVIVARPRSVIVAGGAADHAIVIARRGALVHSSCRQVEGIGFSTVSPDAAVRNCCYWGKRQAVDIGTAWSPVRRGWYAVVRYR